MNPVEYYKIVDLTSIYPQSSELDVNYSGLEYARMGLISEFGEVAGKLKKLFRDGPKEDFVLSMKAELGDCYWYIGAICKETKLSFVGNYEASKRFINPIEKNIFKSLYKANKYIDGICSENDVDILSANIRSLLSVLGIIAEYFNLTPEQVMEYNYNKLTKRKEDGQLRGSGDNR